MGRNSEVLVGCDGSCLKNPGGATGWAWVASDGRWASASQPSGTNQVAELWGVLSVLRDFPDNALAIQIDSEYASLMAELGEDAYAPRAGGAMPLLNEKGEKIPPWRDPNVWNAPSGGADRAAYTDAAADAGWGEQPYDYAQPAGEQRDYSAEWAAYYAAQAAQQGAEAPGAEGQPVRDYTKEWEEYYRQQALAQGFVPVSLGPRVLRAETAPLAALAALL